MKLNDLVLIRGWVNQLDERALNDYADPESESVRKRIARIRRTLAAKARYYRQPEWVELWESANFPVESWINKALASLEVLDRLAEPRISLDDQLGQWFPEKQIKALPAPIATLGGLMDFLDGYYAGKNALPAGFGPQLSILVEFLDAHADELGRSLTKRPAKAQPPAEWALSAQNVLQGQGGGDESLIQAANDWQAASTWLKSRAGRSPRTFEAYYREANRLLAWLDENHLTLGAMKVDHVESYYAHLQDPPAHWLRPRKPTRMASAGLAPTQTLTGELSAKSIDYARTVLSQMCDYLQKAGYLRHNVFRLTSRPARVIQTEVTRYLSLASWQWFWRWLIALPQTTERERLQAIRCRWIFALLYHTGLRREEAAAGTMGNFVRRDQGWVLAVVGKRNKEKIITVNSALLHELAVYRQALGLRAYPSPAESTPLVASVNRNKKTLALTPRAVSGIIRNAAKKAIEECEDEQIRAQIAAMTTHWLRHTNATHRLMAGASLETTQDELGHADPRTTRIYAQTTSLKRREDAEKLAGLLEKNNLFAE